MTYWLAWEEPRAVGDLVHVAKFFARNLGGLIHARPRVPSRLGKATSRTLSRYVDEKSDEAIVPAKRQGEATPGGSRGGKGLTQGEQPLGGRGSDTEPICPRRSESWLRVGRRAALNRPSHDV